MLVSGKKYLGLDQVERDFCSAKQAYAHAQQEEVTEGKDFLPNSQEVSQGGVVRGSTLIETAHPGQAP